MKILHVNMSLNPVTGGGTVERVIQLHKALIESGVESHILTIGDTVESCKKVSVKNITYLPCMSTRWFIPFPDITKVRRLVEQADVIHLMNHWTFINVWVYLLARKLGKPYIVCPAGALTFFGRSQIKKTLYQWLVGKRILRNASAAIAISPHEIEVIEKFGLQPHQIQHIPNGVNASDFSCSSSLLFREKFDLDSPYILFLGRLNLIKGPDLLLAAFAELCNDLSLPFHLVFAGPDGGMLDELKKQAFELGLTQSVLFTGHIGGDLKSSAYHGATILAVPSRHEAMSIVALEAAITATPVLLTDQCGFSPLADVGAAVEVPATIKGIKIGLTKLLVDDCDLLDMGTRGKKFAFDKFSWPIKAQQFIELCNLIEK